MVLYCGDAAEGSKGNLCNLGGFDGNLPWGNALLDPFARRWAWQQTVTFKTIIVSLLIKP